MAQTVIGLFILLISVTIGIVIYARREAKQVEAEKRVILYNRRTRKLKEMFNTEYEKTPSWTLIVTTHGSMFDNFIYHLKKNHMINDVNNPKYNGSPSEGAYILTLEFRKFIHEAT
ncbi:MAG: hypothetical protein H5T96_09810 [Tissierellales bacterium]|nr:hypothetical protein [Tissierellales bacterium]